VCWPDKELILPKNDDKSADMPAKPEEKKPRVSAAKPKSEVAKPKVKVAPDVTARRAFSEA